MPNSSLALRAGQISDAKEVAKSPQLTGLEERLQEENPGSATRVALLSILPKVTPPPTVAFPPLLAGMEEKELAEAISILKLQTGREAVRNGKWAPLVTFLEQNAPDTLKALIDNPRQTVPAQEQEWKKQGLLKGGGAGKLLIGDIGEARRRAVEKISKRTEEETRKKAQVQMQEAEKPRLLAKWSYEQVIPGFRRLAESDLTDFTVLYRAGESLAEPDRGSWTDKLRQLEQLIPQWQPEVPPGSDPVLKLGPVLIQLVKWLDKEWLADRGVLILMSGVTATSVVNILNSLGTAQIKRRISYEVLGHSFPVYLFEAVYPSQRAFQPGFYHGFIAISEKQSSEHVETVWQLGRQYRQRKDLSPWDAAITKLYYEDRLFARYGHAAEYLPVQLNQEILEEVRHALDTMRVEIQAGKSFPQKSVEFQERFAQTHLPPGGLLRRILWQDKILDEHPPESDIHKTLAGKILMELSAELTKAASADDPMEVIGNWLVSYDRLAKQQQPGAPWKVRRPEQFQTVIYGGTKLSAFLLLVEQLGVGQVSWDSRGWQKVPPEQLASWALAIAQRQPEEIRLALKAVYAREFNYPLDEPPFPEIRPDGTLAPRVAAGLEESAQEVFLNELLSANRNLWNPMVDFLRANPAVLDELIQDPSRVSSLVPLWAGVKKGKIKMLEGHLRQAKRKTDQIAAEAKQREEALASIPIEERMAQWTTKELLPALRQIAASPGLTDFSPLRQAGQAESFPGDSQAWFSLVDQLASSTQQAILENSDFYAFRQLVHELIQRWLVNYGLLLFLSSNAGQITPANFARGLVAVRIERKEAYAFGDWKVPVYYVRSPEIKMTAAWDSMGMIVVNLEPIARNAKGERDLLRLPDYPDKFLIESLTVRPPIHRALMRLYGMANQRFMTEYGRDEERYLRDLEKDRLLEELRHWMDHRRDEEMAPARRFVELSGERLNRFVQVHLRASEEGSFLKRVWEEVPGRAPTPEAAENMRQNLANGFLELSAHLYRAVWSPDPSVVVDNWLDALVKVDRELDAHGVAGIFGIRLVADQMGLSREPLSLENWGKIDDAELADLALQFASRPEEFRQAIRAVYEREFRYPIDEAPTQIPYEQFTEGTTGQLPSTEQTGLEETRGIPVDIGRLAYNLQVFSDKGTLTPASLPEGTVTIVDLTLPAGELLVPYLPSNTFGILPSRSNLTTVIQAAPHREIPMKRLIFLEDYQGDMIQAFQQILPQLPKDVKEVRILTGRPKDVNFAIGSLGGLNFRPIVTAVETLQEILEALWVADEARLSLQALLQQAQDNWAGLEEYL